MTDLTMRLVTADPPRELRHTIGRARWRCQHCHHVVNVRRYPDLVPPAVFLDCLNCHLTWELGR